MGQSWSGISTGVCTLWPMTHSACLGTPSLALTPPQWTGAMPRRPQSSARTHSPRVPPVGRVAAVELVMVLEVLWAPAPQHCAGELLAAAAIAVMAGPQRGGQDCWEGGQRTGSRATGLPGPWDAGCTAQRSASHGLPQPTRNCHIRPLCSSSRCWKNPWLARLDAKERAAREVTQGDTGAVLQGCGAVLGGEGRLPQEAGRGFWAEHPHGIHTPV